jgi:hypothetical protein
MAAIPVTVGGSLLLALTFIVLFWRERRRSFGGAERDSLQPLADEIRRPAPRPRP